MAPKKRDLQSDHDLFLHAFEKPTQIYRYLRTRNLISPIFIHRNLTYLKNRSTRTNKSRRTFKVDSLLGIKMNKSRTDNNITWFGDYMTLMFLGFFDKTISDMDVVEVETFLMKISQKKRKDSLKALKKRLGRSVVKINPDDDTTCSNQIPATSVSVENFKQIDGDFIGQSYILQLNVTMLPSYSSVADDDTSTKRIKTSTNVTYESELVVFDKHSRCLLKDGEYELSLQERYPTKKLNKKHATWEDIPKSRIESLDKSGSSNNPLAQFQNCPTLKFRLAWTKEQTADLVDRPLPITANILDGKENQPDPNHNGIASIASSDGGGVGQQQIQIDYQFMYNNNSLQQTETCNNYNCPWCTLNCICLYSLLKHLKLCHDRFHFTYVPLSKNCARIDVTINDLYDGSYTGAPHDLVGPSSAFSRAGPKRRPIVTSILVCRPKRLKPNLTEFLEIDENELNSQRPYITGHNRLYYHTMSCLPLYPKELDIDSEDENDTAWLEKKTTMMIDEFTDVNEGEKELMKMWNLHTIKNGYVGDIQMPLACEMFVKIRGKEIMEKNLYKNLVVHLCNLCDYGLISPEVQYITIQKLQREWNLYENGPNKLIQSTEKQLQYWNESGHLRQRQQQQQQQQQQNQLKLQQQNEPMMIKTKTNDLNDGKLGLATVPLIKISTTKLSSNQSTSYSTISMDENSIASTLSRRKSLNIKDKFGAGSDNNTKNLIDKKKDFVLPRRRMSNATLSSSTITLNDCHTKVTAKKISSRRSSLAVTVTLNSRKRSTNQSR